MSTEYDDHDQQARSRRRRSIATFAIVLLLLFFAVWYSLSYIRADQNSGTGSASSSTSPACTLRPSQVEVNVYNATHRDGLAGRVAQQLKARGFVVKTVANDPKKATITSRGQVRYGRNGRAAAQLVGLHTGPLDRIQDARSRTNVDVVLGPKFRKLASESSIPGC